LITAQEVAGLNPAMVTKKLTNLVSFFFLYIFLTTFNLSKSKKTLAMIENLRDGTALLYLKNITQNTF
jgi:hypothetical protein